jgi:hypothetical protein
MKQNSMLAERRWSPRSVRISSKCNVRVHCEAGDFDAEVINLSSDGFRLRSRDPLQRGWEVTLDAFGQGPVKAVICWACGQDSGGVFAEAVAL